MPTSISQRFSGAETDDFRESPIPESARQCLGFNPCFSFGDAGTFLARFLIISNACAPHSSPTKTGHTGLELLNASIFIFGCDGTHGLIDYLLQTIIFSSFTGRTPVTRLTRQSSGIGLLEGLLPSCTVNRAQSPRRSYGRVVSGHSDGGDLRASTSRRLVRLQQSHGRTTTLRAWRFSQHRVTGEERIGRSTPLPVRPYDDRLAAAITRAAGSRTTRTHSGPPFPARISAETPRRTGHPGATSGVTGAAASPLGHRHNNRPSRCSSECS